MIIIIIISLVLVSPGDDSSLLISARDGVVKDEAEESSYKHACLEQHSDDLIKLITAGDDKVRILLDPLRQHQGEEERESEDEEVPGGVEVNELEVGETHSSDHTKHHTEDAANNGTGDGEKQRS